MRSLIVLLATSFLSAVYAAPTIDDFGALPVIQNMAVSPNGKLIAFRNVSGTEDTVRVVSLTEKKVVAAMDVSAVKPRDVFFINNEQVMLRAAANVRVQRFRGRFDVSTVYSLDIGSGKIRQLLVPGDGVVYPGQSGLGRIVGVSPDGQYAYMPAFYGEPQLVLGQWAAPSYALLRVSIQGTAKPRRVRLGTNETEDYFVADDGEILAMEEFDETKNLHRIMARQGSRWNVIYEAESRLKDRGFMGLTPDRRNLVVLDTSDETGHTAYFTMSLDSGQIEGPSHGSDSADIVRVVGDLNRVVQGVQYSGLMPTYRFFDEALDQRVKDIQAAFPDHAVHIVDFSPDWKHILVLMEGSQSSGEYYLFSAGEQAQYIASQRPAVSPADVNPLGTVTFSARDGVRIPTIITIPKDRIADMQNLPAIVMPHGGPASYDEVGFDYEAQALATQGYLVIMPQFRGSSGFGHDHRAAGHGEWGRKMQDDVSDAVQFFADKGMIDSGRVCIVGGSYGGYSALAGGAFSPDLYKCVVSINGIGDLEGFHSWIRNGQGRSSESLAYWEMQIGKDNYSAEEARARSPEFAADRFSAPVLLIHSKADEVVPFSQSESMHRALEKAGKDVEFVELEGDDHYLSFGETRTRALKATVDFIKDNI